MTVIDSIPTHPGYVGTYPEGYLIGREDDESVCDFAPVCSETLPVGAADDNAGMVRVFYFETRPQDPIISYFAEKQRRAQRAGESSNHDWRPYSRIEDIVLRSGQNVARSCLAIASEVHGENTFESGLSLEQNTFSVSESLIESLRKQFFRVPGVSRELENAVIQTIDLLKSIMCMNIGRPEKEYDPDDKNAWWVRIPVLCHGTVESILSAYNAFNKRFVKDVANEHRDRIVIDLRGDE